jgi:hypothetical protein
MAIEIAKRAVKANDTWDGRPSATFEAAPDGEGWSVLVWRIVGYDSSGKPQFVPGGHRVITIDRDGNITGSMPGR